MTERENQSNRDPSEQLNKAAGGGFCQQKEDLKDKRHFVGVRFVLSNSYSLSSSLPLSFPFLIKQALIWVPSPAAGKEKAACNFERSRVNEKDKSLEHTHEKRKNEEGKKRDVKKKESQGSLFSSQSLVRTAEPLWLHVNDFFFFFLLPKTSQHWNFFVSPSVSHCGCSPYAASPS